jgi:hypothetical protein
MRNLHETHSSGGLSIEIAKKKSRAREKVKIYTYISTPVYIDKFFQFLFFFLISTTIIIIIPAYLIQHFRRSIGNIYIYKRGKKKKKKKGGLILYKTHLCAYELNPLVVTCTFASLLITR